MHTKYHDKWSKYHTNLENKIKNKNLKNIYAYEADLLQGLLRNKDRKLAQIFNFSFYYLADVLSLNNSRFDNYLQRIYLNELEVKDTTESQKYSSYRDLHLEIAKLYDKRDGFTFPIVNFPFISSNIPASPACGVYIF
jgi:hypothetical protein